MQNFLIHLGIGVLTGSTVITLGVKFGMKYYLAWLKKQPKYVQDFAVASGHYAEAAVRFAESEGVLKNIHGVQKLDTALVTYDKLMREAGLDPVTPEAATIVIQAKHQELTDDKLTAFNDPPMSAPAGS